MKRLLALLSLGCLSAGHNNTKVGLAGLSYSSHQQMTYNKQTKNSCWTFPADGNECCLQGVFDCLTGPCVTVPGVGKIQGSTRPTQFTGRDSHHFLGIPFGETTAGEFRFAPPRPKAPLNDGNDAYDASYLSYMAGWWNHICAQPGPGITGLKASADPLMALWAAEHPEEVRALPTGPMIGSEDCLHLAVYTPELPSAESDPKLPVMIYIHGGAFMQGGYVGAGPGKLLERDMVLVAMQYRMGPLGFMCLPDDEIAGNMGLLDQQLALQWVHDHISYFGGDPDRVTIMGESAGSASVTYHMLSDLSQPLFNQAIAESGSALSSWAFDTEPEKHAKEIVAGLSCPTDNIADMRNCLKYETSAKDLVVAHKNYYVSTAGQLDLSKTVSLRKERERTPGWALADPVHALKLTVR